MTLDEAIKNCEKTAKECIENCVGTELYQCDKDFEQLAEWLQELRAYKQLRICSNCRHYVSGTTHFGECHVTSDIEPWVVGVDQTACDTFFDYKEEYVNLNKISYGFYKELKEAKELLKLATDTINHNLHKSCYNCSHFTSDRNCDIGKYLYGTGEKECEWEWEHMGEIINFLHD